MASREDAPVSVGQSGLDAYIRVSRRMGRGGAGYISPDVQREAIARWGNYKGIPILAWHVDEDESGGTHDRPGLNAAIARALAGETGGIVSWKIDRFSRYTEGGLRDLRRLEAANTRLAFVTEDIDTSGPMGKFVYVVMLAMSEYVLDNIKAGWLTAKQRAVERGAVISPTPFGYERNADGSLRAHPAESVIVARAYELAAASGARAATDHLVNTTPDRRWTASTVRRLLASRVYLGESRYGELTNRTAHDPLVTLATWEAAQSIAAARQKSQAFPLSGIAQCGTCGAPMVGGRGGGGNGRPSVRTYRCAATLKTSRHPACERGAHILASTLETHVREALNNALSRVRLTVRETDPVLLAAAERELREAEMELQAFGLDATLRRGLGDGYHAAFSIRVDAVTAARAAYAALAKRSMPTVLPTVASAMTSDMDLAELLRGGNVRILVAAGRGNVSGRVRVIPGDDDDAAGVLASHDPL